MTSITPRTLDTGMRTITERIGGVRSAGMTLLLPCGAAVDPEDALGRAAMWSELLFRGAGGLDSKQQADAFDAIGASRGVEAGSRFMSISAATTGDRLVEALELVAQMVKNPRMSGDSVDPARRLCLQAIESLRDDPQQRAVYAARERHHPEPLNRTGLGTIEGLTALDRARLFGDWKDAAGGAHAILSIAGAIDPDEISDAVDRLFGGFGDGSSVAEAGGTPPRGFAHEKDDSNQVQIVLVHDGPRAADPDNALERVVASVLSGGMSGRLFTEVREKRGLCYAVSASYRGDRDTGTTTAYVGTTPERAQESLDVLTAELLRIQTPEGRITPEEFDRAVVGLKSRLVFGGESTSARASASAADTFKLGHARTLDERAEEIDRVTLDQVNGYLSRRDLGRVTIQTLGPEPLNPPAGLGLA